MRFLAALSLATLASLASLSRAQPANDNIANAISLDANVTLNRVRGNVTGVRADNLSIILPGTTTPTTGYLLPSVWYKWTAPTSGSVNIQGVANNFTVWGTSLIGPVGQSVYTVAGTDASSTVYLNGNSIMSYSFEAVAGVTYLHAIETSAVATPNAYTWVQNFVQAALSDSFSSSTQLGGTDFTVSGNNGSFTQEEGEPDHASNATLSADKSAWMKWTSPNTRKSVTLQVATRTFEPLIAVYSGDALGNLKLITRSSVITNRDGSLATANFVAEDGVEYHFAVDGSRNKSGAFSLKLKADTVRPGFPIQPIATTVEQNTTATFTATAAYTGDTVSYQWQRLPAGSKTWVTLSDDVTFGGTQTQVLTVSATLDMNNDRYRVQAIDSVGTSNSRAVLLTVTEFPAVATEVLGTVDTSIATSTVPEPSNGGGFFATGLPKGLTIDPETGIITGVITAKPGTYRVVYGSTNGKKKNSPTYVLQIVVAPFSSYFTGAFEALLVSPDSQAVPHGKLTLKVATNGSFTGSYFLLETGKSSSFRGSLVLNQTLRTASNPAATPITLSRGKSAAPLRLNLTLAEPPASETPTPSVLSATVEDETDLLLALADDGAPVSRFNAANPAAWAGRYTISLTGGAFIPAPLPPLPGTPDIPLGSGHATATIAANTGALSLRGYLADSTRITATLPSSPSATYRMGQRIYGPGGSLAGKIRLVEQIAPDFSTLDYHSGVSTGSSLFWAKPPRPKDKLYPDGFNSGTVLLTMIVEPWTDPAGNFTSALGLAADGEMKVHIVAKINQDGNDNNQYRLPVDVRISANGSLSFDNPPDNPTKFTVKFDAASGSFSGSYELAEETPAPGTKPRKVTFSGVMMQPAVVFQGDIIGEGFAIVPPLDAGEVTTSARIEFLAGEPESPFGIDSEH